MIDPLWRGEELSALFGAPSASLKGEVTGVSIDSRSLKAGDLFVAIRGDALDGHAFVERAFAAGASAALCETSRPDLAGFGPVYAVDDTLRAMERLGVAARARASARIAAVTGSVGKTSAKEMLRLALGASGATHASAASFNNHWGVPLTLSRLRRDARFAVFEIGMNHAGEITPLVGFVRPHVALVTTIAPVHIEYLGSIEAIADAKAEIFSGLVPGGVAIINRDAPQAARLRSAADALDVELRTFGASDGGHARLVACEPSGGGSRLKVRLGENEYAFTLGAPGLHMAENAVGVLAVVEALGADVAAAAQALESFAPPKGRGERFTLPLPGGALTVIDESYNANPVSMRAALALLRASTPGAGGRRIAVVGDMLELGLDSAALHESLAPDLEDNGVDLLFAAGPLSRALYDAAPVSRRAHWAEAAGALQAPLFAQLRGGDVVMVKASNGSRMGPLVTELKAHFAMNAKRGD